MLKDHPLLETVLLTTLFAGLAGVAANSWAMEKAPDKSTTEKESERTLSKEEEEQYRLECHRNLIAAARHYRAYYVQPNHERQRNLNHFDSESWPAASNTYERLVHALNELHNEAKQVK